MSQYLEDKASLSAGKDEIAEDAKMLLKAIWIVLLKDTITPSQRDRAWNVIRAAGATFRDAREAKTLHDFKREHNRFLVALEGLVDILGIGKE